MNLRSTVFIISTIFLFSTVTADYHQTDWNDIQNNDSLDITDLDIEKDQYEALNWTEANLNHHSYKENSSQSDTKDNELPETSGQQSFINSFGGLYKILIDRIESLKENERSSINQKVHRESFNATGDFGRINWNRYSENGDLFTHASTEEWEYLLKNGEVIEQSRSIEKVKIAGDSAFYKAYSHGTNQEIVYRQEVLTKINRKDGLLEFGAHDGKPVYVVFDSEDESQKVYKKGQLIYKSIDGSIESIHNLDGKLGLTLIQDGREYLLVGERKYGPVEDIQDVAYNGEDFCIAEEKLVHCGDEKLSAQVNAGKLHKLDGKLIYKAVKNVSGAASVKDHIMLDGESVASKRKILRLEVGEDGFFYTALNKDGSQGIYSSEAEIERFPAVNDLEIIEGSVATAVRSDGEWRVFFNGSTLEPGFGNIFYLQKYRGKPLYVGEKDGREVLMHGEEEIVSYSDLDITSLTSGNKSFSYTVDRLSEAKFGFNGKEGRTVETEFPAQFSFYGSTEGKPVYSYWEVREGPDYDSSPREGRVLVKGDTVLEKQTSIHGGAVVDGEVLYTNDDQLIVMDSFNSKRFEEIPFDFSNKPDHGHNPFMHKGKLVYTPRVGNVYGDDEMTAYKNNERITGYHEDLSQIEVFRDKIMALEVDRDDYQGENLYLGKKVVLKATGNYGPVYNGEIFSESAREKIKEEMGSQKFDGYRPQSRFSRLYTGEDMFAISIKTEKDSKQYNKIAVFRENSKGKLDVSFDQIGYSEMEGTGYDAERSYTDYQQVLDGKFIGGDFVFWSSAWEPYRTAVYSDGSFGETYQDIGEIFDVDGELAYTAFENDTWYLIKEGEEIQSFESEPENLEVIDGKMTYAVNRELYHGDRKYSYDSIAEFKEIGNSLGFIYSEDGNQKLWWNEETVDSTEGEIKQLNEKNGEPLYMIDSSDRKIIQNGDELTEVPSGSKIYSDDGVIGYRKVNKSVGRNSKLIRAS